MISRSPLQLGEDISQREWLRRYHRSRGRAAAREVNGFIGGIPYGEAYQGELSAGLSLHAEARDKVLPKLSKAPEYASND